MSKRVIFTINRSEPYEKEHKQFFIPFQNRLEKIMENKIHEKLTHNSFPKQIREDNGKQNAKKINTQFLSRTDQRIQWKTKYMKNQHTIIKKNGIKK